LYKKIGPRYFQTLPPAMKRTRIKVLVLGRGAHRRKQIAELLSRAGYAVTTESGSDGQSAARRSGGRMVVLADPAPAARAAGSRAPRGKAMSLQQLREHVNQTQGDVARRAAVSQPQLSRVEGRRDHLVSTVRKYVRALGGEVQMVAEIGPERIVLRDV
jgi:hypothetical protein